VRTEERQEKPSLPSGLGGTGERASGFSALNALLAAFLAAGLAIRVWVMVSPAGVLDADGAIIGLMARHFLRGELTAFYWGQAYGGSHEALLAALVFLGLGATSIALKLVPVSLSAVAALLIWRIGRRTLGEPAARIGAVLFWIWSPFFLAFSAKMGTYWASLCSALLVLLLLVRLRDRDRWPLGESALLGLAVGNAVWANAQTLYIIVPAVAFFARRGLANWRRFPVMALFVAVGALPSLVYNLGHDWASLEVPPQPESSFGGNLGLFFGRMLPMALGLRIPYTAEWVLGPAGKLAYGLVLALFALALWKRPRGSGVFLLTALMYPLIYALSPLSWFWIEPRYLLFLMPAACLLLGYGLSTLLGAGDEGSRVRRLGPAAVAVSLLGALALAFPALRTVSALNSRPPTGQFGALHALLREEGVEAAYADYWVSYKTTFETGERIIVAPAYSDRYPPYARKLAGTDFPTFVFMDRPSTPCSFERLTKDKETTMLIRRRGPWVVLVPSQRISPLEVEELKNRLTMC
jgi:hypothetical protein